MPYLLFNRWQYNHEPGALRVVVFYVASGPFPAALR